MHVMNSFRQTLKKAGTRRKTSKHLVSSYIFQKHFGRGKALKKRDLNSPSGNDGKASTRTLLVEKSGGACLTLLRAMSLRLFLGTAKWIQIGDLPYLTVCDRGPFCGLAFFNRTPAGHVCQ